METAIETTFSRSGYESALGDGESISWTNARGETLAYLDHLADGTAAVTVFVPYLARRREYAARNPRKALAIVERHLAKEGYVRPAPAAEEPGDSLHRGLNDMNDLHSERQAAPVEKTPQDVLDDVFGPTLYLTRHVVRGGRHYQLFLRRDDVPAIELEDGLIRWTKGIGGPYTATSGGEIVLWSARGWNVGYAVWLPEMDGSK